MRKWKTKIILRSGKELNIFYESEKPHPNYIAEEILDNDFGEIVGFINKNETENIYIKKNEIAGIRIWK